MERLQIKLKKRKIDYNHLEKPETFAQIAKLVDEYIKWPDRQLAFDMVKFLQLEFRNKEFETQYPELYQKYKALMPKLYFVGLPGFSEEEILNFLKKHFIEFLSNENIDIFEQVRDCLIKNPIEFRDDFKKQIRDALQEDQETIGTQDITISGEKTPLKPIVKNWLKEYKKSLGVGYHTNLDRRGYLSQSKNANLLSEKQRNYLSDLLMFYELLKISSYQEGALDNWSLEIFDPANIHTPIPEKRKATEEKLVPQTAIKPIEKSQTKPTIKPLIKTKSESVKPAPKIVKAVPEKEVAKEMQKPKPEIQVKPELELPLPPKKVFHKISKPIVPPEPVSPEISKIQNISLVDFKNLGPTAKQSAQALLAKIRDIAKTHEERKSARANFTKSSLYKLYQDMENQSATEKKSISQLAEERKKQAVEFLTEDEYIAVKSVSKLI